LFLLAFFANRCVRAQLTRQRRERFAATANIQNADAHIQSSSPSVLRIATNRHNYATAISGCESLNGSDALPQADSRAPCLRITPEFWLPKTWATTGAFSLLTLALKLAQY
jgi:hypothetical protein